MRKLEPALSPDGQKLLYWKCSDCAWVYSLNRPFLVGDVTANQLAEQSFKSHNCAQYPAVLQRGRLRRAS